MASFGRAETRGSCPPPVVQKRPEQEVLHRVRPGQHFGGIAGVVPGIDRHPLKKLAADESGLLALLQRWKQRAVKTGREIKRRLLIKSGIRSQTDAALSIESSARRYFVRALASLLTFFRRRPQLSSISSTSPDRRIQRTICAKAIPLWLHTRVASVSGTRHSRRSRALTGCLFSDNGNFA